MIEAIIIAHLGQVLDVPVYAERPAENVPELWVLVEKTGSSRENRIDSATVAVQSYAPTLLGAAQLNEEVKSAMDSLIEVKTVSRSALNSDYNFTDTATKTYRYQAVYDITYHKE